MVKGAIPTAALTLITKKFTAMLKIKFETDMYDKGQFILFPTVAVDGSEIVSKSKVQIGFAWLCGEFIISFEWKLPHK